MLGAVVLFILLSPGLLLTLPPVGKKVFMSCQTSVAAILVHALVFAVALKYLPYIPVLNQLDGFQGKNNGSGPKRMGPVSGALTAVGDIVGAVGQGVNTVGQGLEGGADSLARGVQSLNL